MFTKIAEKVYAQWELEKMKDGTYLYQDETLQEFNVEIQGQCVVDVNKVSENQCMAV